ncbi:hypothetical protein HPB50_010329 [Hyalomma asiaticum]|uniref:Uncharacterized protein n=1 Tax=Hyalomma asiaticum TaxID=266040 RepID=A0ACB7STK9_HYAAI|nr:hypothetical protein HPB50_010329 [Hyalomma asiaticum]
MEQGNRKRRCRSERRLTALTHQQRRRSRKTTGKEQHQRSTRVSPAGNAAAAPPHHHGDARSPRIPPAWTSRLCSLHPNLQVAATTTCPPGQAKEEANPAGSEEPWPNEAARVMMQKAARDQGFTNWLLQVATNNRSGGAHKGATRTTGLPKPAAKMAAIPEPAATTAPAATYRSQAAAMQVGLLATPTAEPTEVQEDMARDTSCLLLLKDDVRFTRRAVSVVGGPS